MNLHYTPPPETLSPRPTFFNDKVFHPQMKGFLVFGGLGSLGFFFGGGVFGPVKTYPCPRPDEKVGFGV